MSPITRRTTAAPPAASDDVNFGSLNTYSGGFSLPEGDYALEFIVRNGNPNANPPGTRLGVLITCHPIKDGALNGEPQDIFISMGSKAEHTFAPNPDTGKGVVKIPGGAGGVLNNKTNWFAFLKSLYDAGMPEGTFINDLTVIDGIWVHTQNIPEPEERKSFGARTGEAAQDERQGSGLMTVVTAILDGGEPWAGGGGIPEAGAKPTKVAGKIAPKTTAKVAPKAAAVVEEEAEPGEDEQAIIQAATNGMAAVLEKLKPNATISNLQLRTQTFQAVSKVDGAEMAQAVQTDIFGNPDRVASLLGELGFSINAGVIKQA